MTLGAKVEAPAGASDAKTARRAIAAGAVGNFVEFFDWNIYAYMAPIFAAAFFRAENPLVGLLMAFSVFALGVLTRPLGALVFGAYSDRLGRRNSISLSIIGMALASFIIGVCPDFNTIGVTAPIVLIVARLLQGICAGGEGGSASTYLVEFAPPGRRAAIASFQQISTGCATLAALGVSAAIAALLSPEDLSAWGWRLPFLLGAALGVVGLIMRRAASETPVFVSEGTAPAQSFWRQLAGAWRGVALAAGIGIFPSVGYLSWQIYLPTFLTTSAGLTRADALTVTMIGVVVFLALIFPMAVLSDRVGRKPILATFAVMGLIWSIPTYLLLPTLLATWHGALLVSVVGNAILAVMAGPLVASMTEVFSTRVRATGYGLGYAIAVVSTGGTFPPLVTALAGYRQFGWILAYVVVAGAISLVAYISMPETRDRSL